MVRHAAAFDCVRDENIFPGLHHDVDSLDAAALPRRSDVDAVLEEIDSAFACVPDGRVRVAIGAHVDSGEKLRRTAGRGDVLAARAFRGRHPGLSGVVLHQAADEGAGRSARDAGEIEFEYGDSDVISLNVTR